MTVLWEKPPWESADSVSALLDEYEPCPCEESEVDVDDSCAIDCELSTRRDWLPLVDCDVVLPLELLLDVDAVT